MKKFIKEYSKNARYTINIQVLTNHNTQYQHVRKCFKTDKTLLQLTLHISYHAEIPCLGMYPRRNMCIYTLNNDFKNNYFSFAHASAA